MQRRRSIFEKGKERAKKVVKQETVKEVKKTVKAYSPFVTRVALLGIGFISTMAMCCGSKPSLAAGTVNNYYIYNGPVYRT